MFSDKSSEGFTGFVQLHGILPYLKILRAKWRIQFWMSFHILFLGEKHSLPTISHIFASYMKKTANWRYLPQISKAQNSVTFNSAPQVWSWEKMVRKNILFIRFNFCLQCCDLVQQL